MKNRVILSVGLMATLFLAGCPKKSTTDGRAETSKKLIEHPVGTGPFVFKKWNRDENIVLTSNAEYWGGAPKVKTLIVVPVTENSTRLEKLKKGEIQVLDGLRPADAKGLKGNADIKVLRQPGMNMGYLAMNVEKAPFNNKKVRQAVAAIIPKNEIIRLNFEGFATAAVNPMPPNFYGWDDSGKVEAPNFAKAKKLMAESGLKLPITTELWHMPNPRPYMTEPNKIALLIRESLKKIGIEASLVTKKWEFYLSETKKGNHPMCLLGWTADVADPDNFLYLLLGKDNIGATNVARYANKEVNDLLIKAQSTISLKERSAIYKKVQQIIRDEAPMVPLVHADQLMAYRSNVKGFNLHATGRKDFDKVDLGKETLVFARGGDSSKLDPAFVDDGESVAICTSVYEGLVRYKRGSTDIEPCLATSWKQSKDGKEWTFELRKGVKFHDGTPFNAEAVIFNFERLVKKDNPYHDEAMLNQNLYKAITKIEKVGDHTVKFVLDSPVASFLGNLTVYTAMMASPKAIKRSKELEK